MVSVEKKILYIYYTAVYIIYIIYIISTDFKKYLLVLGDNLVFSNRSYYSSYNYILYISRI